MCHSELDKRPVLLSVNWPEADGLGLSGIMSRNLSRRVLNEVTGALLIEFMLRGRQFHRFDEVRLKEFDLAICAGL